MPTGHVFIATSLDGYIARPDDDLDWLALPGADGEDHGYTAFIETMDCIVMGRGTYDKVRTFDPWPYTLPVIVLSRTLEASAGAEPLPGPVMVQNATPEDAMQFCSTRGWRRVYVDGGQIIQSFLRAGLIHDMVLTRIPVLLGAGKPLFGPLDQDIALVHETTRSFPSGLTQSKYRVVP
ncbi:MAG: dihydrofolate reductase family protein [Pseudomonadota bacterium]